MAISGVGGTPQGDPLQAQRIEVRQKWDQLNMDLAKLSNALKKSRNNMTVKKLNTGRPPLLRPGVVGDVRDLINQIRGIQRQLNSLKNSGGLALLAGNKTKGDELFNELSDKLDAVQQPLQRGLNDVNRQRSNSQKINTMKRAIGKAMKALNEIVQ